jgi:nitrate reductase assembly molybdenum cofactor insertion protein NarJ
MSAAAAFRLASHAAAYPAEGFAARLREGLDDCARTEGMLSGERWQRFAAFAGTLADAAVEDLCADYIDLFDRAQDNPLSETEYGGRGEAKGADLADIAGFYQAFGVRPAESSGLIDHLAVELEFYGWLCAKQEFLDLCRDDDGVAVVSDGRRKFLHQHLGRFANSVATRPAVVAHPFYGPALAWCADLVHRECELLGVEPTVAPHRLADEEGDLACCAAAGAAAEKGRAARLPVL